MQFISPLPQKFADFLNTFNLTNSVDLRRLLLVVNDWETDYNIDMHHDLDWIKYTIYSFVRLYESEALKCKHEESWYNSRVWSLIDTIFDDIKTLQVLR